MTQTKHTASVENVLQHLPLFNDDDGENGGLEELARAMNINLPCEATQEQAVDIISPLITAAPELLEACGLVHNYLYTLPMLTEEQEALLEKLVKAISKAEGK